MNKEQAINYLKASGMSDEQIKAVIDAFTCDDCISREEVRRILANQRNELMRMHIVNPEDNPKADAMAYGVNWSLNTLMELLSVTPQQTTWIPVSEKMPPIAQRVLVSATNGEVFIARYHSFDKWTFEPTGISYAYKKDSIVAWMPLPESYKIPAQTFGCAED